MTGASSGIGRALAQQFADHGRPVDLSCRSTVHLAKLLSRHMVARKEARPRFTASVAATWGDTEVGSGRRDDAEDVARDGFEALMAGKDHVVAGSAKNRLMAAGSSAMLTRGPPQGWPMTEPGSGDSPAG